MAVINVNPTASELSRLKKKLNTARRGHKLLKDKHDELTRKFIELAHENMRLRKETESTLKIAAEKSILASCFMSRAQMDCAFMTVSGELEIEVSYRNITGMKIPTFKTKKDFSFSPQYSFGFTAFELDGAVESYFAVFEKLIKLAQKEKSLQLMADKIEKTRRRVNALEHIMIPRYEETIKYIETKIEENERSTAVRLLKAKELVLVGRKHNQI